MGWKGFGEKGRGRVSGLERFWRGGGGLEIFCRVRVFII